MKIKIIVEASTKLDRMMKQWGLSILVGNDVLFDTFSDPKTLVFRMRKARVDLSAVRHVVISHDHWDHTGGLWRFLEQNKNCRVYVCANSSEELKNKIRASGATLVEVTGPFTVSENIYSTGEIEGAYDGKPMFEQALVVKVADKLAVLTGCSHPGILLMLARARDTVPGDIDLVMGGFHLADAKEDELGNIVSVFDREYRIKKLAPFHCTGKRAVEYFRECMPDQYVRAKSGNSFFYSQVSLSWEPENRLAREC